MIELEVLEAILNGFGHQARAIDGWKVESIGDVLNTVLRIRTPEEAAHFMEWYKDRTLNAESNVGYITGYCGENDAQRIFEWFGVSHPIFGKRYPTGEEAFKVGMRFGELCKEHSVDKAIQILAQENTSPWHVGALE